MSHLNAAIPAVGHRLIQGVEEIQRVKGDPATWETATATELTTYKDIYDVLKNPALALQATQAATERGPLPAGQYWTEADAKAAAELSGLKGPQPIGDPLYDEITWTESEYRTYVKAGRWSFEEAATPIEDLSLIHI